MNYSINMSFVQDLATDFVPVENCTNWCIQQVEAQRHIMFQEPLWVIGFMLMCLVFSNWSKKEKTKELWKSIAFYSGAVGLIYMAYFF